MGMNQVCPKCGSSKVQLTDANKSHSLIKLILFGWAFLLWRLFKFILGLMIILVWDWWFAIIMKIAKKRYLWIGKNLMKRRKSYYCHDCGYNFKA